MKKSFNQYTDEELLTLDQTTIDDAIRIEAIARGVQPPVPLSEALRVSEWRGYRKPGESFPVYEIIIEDKYHNPSCTGLAYLDETCAVAALEGAVSYDANAYGKGGPQIKIGTPGVAKRFIGVSESESRSEKFEAFKQDNTKFDEICDECVARLGKVRQEDYNKRVNAEKKLEYLRLAGGDETIAKGFWAKVENTVWPE